MVDDAHGIGVCGEQGRGSCWQQGVRPELLVVTFGKAFGISGAILFSTLAQGSLHELGDAWQQVDGERHVNDFLPLAAIDAACAGYRHCLEAQWRTLNYPDVMALMRSLKGIGATHLHQGRESGLMSRRQFAALQAAYPCLQGQFPLSYHLIYGVIYRD